MQFSADGKRILFLSARDGGKQQVFMADFDAASGDTTSKFETKLTFDCDGGG